MNSKTLKVLLIDDSPLVLNLLKNGLKIDPSLEIATAEDGIKGLEMVDSFDPDVIVLDLEMPRMNGIEFLRILMPKNPKPVIVVSSLTKSDNRITQDIFEAGAIDYLSKPSSEVKNSLQTMISQLWAKIKLAQTKVLPIIKNSIDKPIIPNNLRERTDKIKQSVLGMGALAVTDQSDYALKIFALGSCVGTAIYSSDLTIVAFAHIVLPSSKTDMEKAKSLPGYFADTAIPTMINEINRKYKGERIKLFAKMAGGAKTNAELGDYFSVGLRNSIAVKEELRKHNIPIVAEDLGGAISRTASVFAGDSKMKLFLPEKGTWEI